MIEDIFIGFMVVFFLKSFFVGSDFNLWLWLRYGKVYTKWYFDKERNTFKVD